MRPPFRIYRYGISGPSTHTSLTATNELKLYTDRLVKLIPAEVLAAYTAGRGIRPEYIIWWAPVCLLILLAIRTWGTKDVRNNPQSSAISISAISFVLWVYSAGDSFFGWVLPDTAIASLAMIAWVVVLPIFFKGEE